MITKLKIDGKNIALKKNLADKTIKSVTLDGKPILYNKKVVEVDPVTLIVFDKIVKGELEITFAEDEKLTKKPVQKAK